MGAPALGDEAAPRVALTLPSCGQPQLPLEQVRSAVALELASEGLVLVTDGDLAFDPDVQASIRTNCQRGAPLLLRAEWGTKSGERALQIGELPPAVRPRAIALALAELLAALRPPHEVAAEDVELAEDAAPSSERSAAAAPSAATASTGAEASAKAVAARSTSNASNASPEREAASERDAGRTQAPPSQRPALALSLELRSFEFKTNTEGLRAHYDFSGWGIGVATLFGRETGTLGLATGLIVHGYCEKHVTLLGHPDRAWLTLGPRAGLGVVEVSSTANPGALDTTVAEPYLDLAAFLELSTSPKPFRFGARVELGYALGLIALEDDRRLASYGGVFGGVLLDAALLL